ncbi:MAG: tetraacyldisaccharide 4'-kinase [Verrucomicrobiota bacterium]|nr:tetraacyldisaccharide 4'-kinase [Verrucomicrobiota bacterium]
MSFREQMDELEQFALDVILEKRYGKRAAFFRSFLLVLSRLYAQIVRLRLYLYHERMFHDHSMAVQVISVGNLTVGGTGKTPVVEKFARALTAKGRKVAILSRGYKSTPRPFKDRMIDKLLMRTDEVPPRVVSDGHKILLDSEHAGDEPFMLATNLQNVLVIVDKDRVKAARYAVEKFGANTLVLDDGFQYLRLKPWKQRKNRKHFDIVLVDRQAPWGNNFLLPRGTLREPPENIIRATHIFITKSDGNNSKALRAELEALNPHAEIIECNHEPLHLIDIYTKEKKPLEFLKGLKVGAISGIAKPESFEEGLRNLGADLVYSRAYADHHRFTVKEIQNTMINSLRREADAVITTEKDAVRFPLIEKRNIPVYFLRVEIKIVKGYESFEDCVSKLCFEEIPDPASTEK